MTKNIIALERNPHGVLKNRRKYPSLIVAMTRVFEQCASKMHGFNDWSHDPFYEFPVLSVDGMGENDARKFLRYFEVERSGTLLNRQNIYIKNNPFLTIPDKGTIESVKQELDINKHAFAIIFHKKSAAQKVLRWLQNNLPHVLIYKDKLAVQQKIQNCA